MNQINWKIVAATLTSSLTVLAALPYQLGDLATIIPPEWKGKVVIAGLVATTILRLINTKMIVPAPPPPTAMILTQQPPVLNQQPPTADNPAHMIIDNTPKNPVPTTTEPKP